MQIELVTARLRLRQWCESDRDHSQPCADPSVMEFFPSPSSPQASDASIDLWQSQFSSQGWRTWAIELLETGYFAGFLGPSVRRRVLPFSSCVEIG
jgi:RimJ/RimL family protein N-acetyltransferase